ncbi:tubulin-specific chaperone E [Xyrauchen texanus]|uniref:tubulin-specific chaperone E n=1 Tax=Xyrauchen texanus TaxID=154827 RepID=UPI0022424F75|nr:tubulin-specific chaperone E [Xyrauchen texanus]XP_051967112.1 tubulin-specific chaperone E [Xyrauchen texanus]
MMTRDVPEDAVGRRVSCDGERGTVRYVGTVPPTAGLWLGVEWDNPERGKHDGSHEGVRYFTCRHPTGGSFVRPKKASFGVDYLTALKQRYEVELEEAIGEEFKFCTKTVMMVGFEAVKQKQRVENLTEIALRSCEVSGPGPENEIRKTTPFAQSLDLSGNLLSSWEVLAEITQQLESMQVLQLSYNRLSLSSDPTSLSPAFSRLRVLSVKSCALTWSQVLHCAPMWQQLEELYLADNDITELVRPVSVLQTLKVLDLSNNRIVQETALEISHLPRLENLNLSCTGVSVIQFSDASAGNKTALFPALKKLLLDDNNISEWSVVNELEKLSCLVQLSCRRNPLLQKEKNYETARQLFIARLSQLELLDMRQVLSDERRGAELDYCKMFGLAWLQAGGHCDPEKNHPSTEFNTEHPRYLALIQKYGPPDESELREQKPFALKNQLLTITFVCPDDAERKPIEKKLPGSMIVQKVKGLLHRLLKLPGAELKLAYTCAKMADREIEIDNDLKPLQFYSVEDGDRILVRWS